MKIITGNPPREIQSKPPPWCQKNVFAYNLSLKVLRTNEENTSVLLESRVSPEIKSAPNPILKKKNVYKQFFMKYFIHLKLL